MNVIRDLAELPERSMQAVIINCGTKWVTTLALVSTLRHTGGPVLIVDCESKDGSRRHFEDLSARYSLAFAWLEWPLRPHPMTLDRLFRLLRSETTLLVDSDVEIRTGRVVSAMQAALGRDSKAYGAGFLQGPAWLGREHGLREFTGYYEERMWIPLVLLRTAPIRKLLEVGHSFANRRPYFEFRTGPRLARVLGYRHRIRGLRNLSIPLPQTKGNRPTYDGRTPAFVEYDTGADLHAAFKNSGNSFSVLPSDLWGEVHHYHGVTRAHLTGAIRRFAKRLRLASRDTETDQQQIVGTVMQRLSCVYDIDDPDWRG